MTDSISQELAEAARALQACADPSIVSCIREMGDAIVTSLLAGGKLMLCGNGGSAADAQHLAAELLVRLKPHHNRAGIPAIALAMDTSTLTACGNDFGFDVLYARMVETLGKPGDVLLGISTSGESPNICLALEAAAANGVVTLGFLGRKGGRALSHCQLALRAPSDRTGIIQQVHIAAGHAMLGYVEERLLAVGHLQLKPAP